jgi:hypothetical protein
VILLCPSKNTLSTLYALSLQLRKTQIFNRQALSKSPSRLSKTYCTATQLRNRPNPKTRNPGTWEPDRPETLPENRFVHPHTHTHTHTHTKERLCVCVRVFALFIRWISEPSIELTATFPLSIESSYHTVGESIEHGFQRVQLNVGLGIGISEFLWQFR